MAKSDLRIDILGTSFSISADEDQAYLESLLNYYRIKVENTRKRTGLQDPLKLALVTGFLLCDDLFKGSAGDEQDEAERLTLDLISRIDAALSAGDAFPAASGGEPPEGAYRGPPFFKLENTVKHYEWGSPRWIPRLLNQPNEDSAPWAELWMGAPSRTGAEARPLGEIIAEHPDFYLGPELRRNFGTLPFLFKLLAAGKPLSLQAHPEKEQARRGWEKENRQGLPPEDPGRNYRDPNGKPELLCALGNFRALCGFRERRDIRRLLELFGGEAFDGDGVKPSEALKEALLDLKDALDGEEGLRDMLGLLLGLDPETLRDLGVYSLAQAPQLEESYPEYAGEWRAVAGLAELYPEDPGILAPLFLNLLRLKHGEAIFLPPGVLHTYLEGFGAELQADSDNVVRGGLTAKHVDVEELFAILRFTPYQPAVLQGAELSAVKGWYAYPAVCREFSLYFGQSLGDPLPLPPGPLIVLVTQGQARLSAENGEDLVLGPGESAFAAPGTAYLEGNFTAFAAGPGEYR
ncbi:MAG: mannose-6-phosphate isomerase, class I [Spirochaetaceae bacterium]|nr:mannose-6-phosphate isomerase, class I [Spirochaetaceae bacterium]